MLLLTLLIGSVLPLTKGMLLPRAESAVPQDLSLDNYVQAQTKAALAGILANSAEYPGVIAASLARDTARAGETGGQNYYYQWTRDASLTMKTIINQYASGDSSLEPFIKAFIENESKLQHLDTLSGNFTTGGLGEPKYYMNSTAFNAPWGRPQRDGPALRAIAIMGFLSLLNDTAYISNITETVVKPDLDYVAANWQSSGFDLWEEQNGTHFFTAMVQSRALQDGAAFMQNVTNNQSAAFVYLAQDGLLGSLIDSFWNSTGNGTFVAKLNGTRPTGSDCANLLASLHGSKRYLPSSDKILASTATLIDEMSGLYDIDSEVRGTAIPIGRYPSDVYDGIQSSEGNPWFLCNSAVAEVLYLAANDFVANVSTASINNINRNFMKRLLPGVSAEGELSAADKATFVENLRLYADDFLAVEQQFVGANFSMSEQINRTTGVQQGAHDLTWSYAAFISAARARSGQQTYHFASGSPENALLSGSDDGINSTFTSGTIEGSLADADTDPTKSHDPSAFASKQSTTRSGASVMTCSLPVVVVTTFFCLFSFLSIV